jgi:hypothetical protein
LRAKIFLLIRSGEARSIAKISRVNPEHLCVFDVVPAARNSVSEMIDRASELE